MLICVFAVDAAVGGAVFLPLCCMLQLPMMTVSHTSPFTVALRPTVADVSAVPTRPPATAPAPSTVGAAPGPTLGARRHVFAVMTITNHQ